MLYCEFTTTSPEQEKLLDQGTATPSRLHSLYVDLSDDSLPVLRNLVAALQSESASTLKMLQVPTGHGGISTFLPLASDLTSLDLYNCCYNPEDSISFPSVVKFLNQATNLIHLQVEYNDGNDLSHIFRALNCHIENLELMLSPTQENRKAIPMVKIFSDAAKVNGSALSTLAYVLFRGPTKATYERFKGWKELTAVLEKNGSKVWVERDEEDDDDEEDEEE